MADSPSTLQKQLAQFWSGLSRAKRVALIAVTATVLLGVMAISVLGSRVSFVPLYTGLSTEDSGSIVVKLKELKIPHRVTPVGIEVPEDRVHELRLQLASAGLPRGGGVGFEIFDNSRLGATEFEQHVNLRRALEGELSRSITTLSGVLSARVHLVMPERRLFAARSEGASASVVIKLESARDFGRREVAGIVHLVSSAVPALAKNRVSVVSTDGVTLHRPDSEEGGNPGMDENQTHAARALAAAMENHVRTLLERVTGPGGVDVRINVDLQEASRERTEEHYEPTKTALRSEHKSEETTSQEGTTVAGVPGAQTNLPDVEESVAARASELDGNIFRTTRTRNWEVDRITEKIITPSGNVSRVSAAVLIDGIYEEKDGVQVYQPRDPKELERLEEVVKNAIGFSAIRGDSIRIEGAKFSRAAEPEPQAERLRLERYLPYALAAIGFLTLLTMFMIFMKAVKSQKVPALGAGETAAERLQEGSGQALPVDGAVRASLAAGAAGPALSAASPQQLEERRAAALEVAAKDPTGAAIILSGWLNSGATPRDEAASGES